MECIKTDLIKFNSNRLYVIDIVKYRFKKYLVCVDLTSTIKENGRVIITILTKTSGKNYGAINSKPLFDKLYEKCKKQLKCDSKNVLNITSDALGTRTGFTPGEHTAIAKSLDMLLYE